MTKDNYNLRPLERFEVDTLIDWALKENWNPGLHDAEIFYATDPKGFYGFFLEDEMIGGGSLVSYQGEYGFMGLFIMRPEYRGKGLGRQLWFKRRDTLIDRLKPGAIIGMDGVPDMQAFYAKGGFEKAFVDERYAFEGKQFPKHDFIYPFVPERDLKELIEYDSKCFGVNRSAFIEKWVKQPSAKVFVSRKESINGYVVLRDLHKGKKIAPLFADRTDIAHALFETVLSEMPEESAVFDIPLVNKNAIDLVKKYKGVYQSECARMYYGDGPQPSMEKVYGITSFELG